MYRLNAPCLASTIIVLLTTVAHSQDVRPSRTSAVLTISVQIEEADNEPSGFRLYHGPHEIVASIALFNTANEPAAPILIDTMALRQNLRITLEQQTDLGATVRWLPNPPRGGAAGQEPPIPPQVSLFRERGFGLRAAILPKGDRFAPGTYTVRAILNDASTVASSTARLPLKMPAASAVTLTVVEPQTPAERASAHRQLGRAALRRSQLDDAEREFQLAAQVGGGKSGLGDLGYIYIQRRKYREAVDCFERLLPDLSRGNSLVPQLLAEAYIGVGDESNAVRVLIDKLGMSDQTLAMELERLRQSVNRRSSR